MRIGQWTRSRVHFNKKTQRLGTSSTAQESNLDAALVVHFPACFQDKLPVKGNSPNKYAFGAHAQTNAIGTPETGYLLRSPRNERYRYIINENSKVMFSGHFVIAAPERFFFSWSEAADAGKSNPTRLVDKYLVRPREELYIWSSFLSNSIN